MFRPIVKGFVSTGNSVAMMEVVGKGGRGDFSEWHEGPPLIGVVKPEMRGVGDVSDSNSINKEIGVFTSWEVTESTD